MQSNAPRLLLAGTGSGCGKTTVTSALLRALSRMAWNSVPVQLMNVVNGSAMLVARSTAAPVSTRPPSLGLSMRTIHGAAAAMITASAVRADILAAQQKRNALFSRA